MKFEIKVSSKNKPDGWWECYDEEDVKDLEQAVIFGIKLVEWFNSTNPYGHYPRVFITARTKVHED